MLSWETKNYLSINWKLHVGGYQENADGLQLHSNDHFVHGRDATKVSLKQLCQEGARTESGPLFELYIHVIGFFLSSRPVYVDNKPYWSVHDLP